MFSWNTVKDLGVLWCEQQAFSTTNRSWGLCLTILKSFIPRKYENRQVEVSFSISMVRYQCDLTISNFMFLWYSKLDGILLFLLQNDWLVTRGRRSGGHIYAFTTTVHIHQANHLSGLGGWRDLLRASLSSYCSPWLSSLVVSTYSD